MTDTHIHSNGTIKVAFKRTTNRDALARSIIYEWLKPPDSVEVTASENGSFYLFAQLVAGIQTAEGLPFDPAQVRQDKAAALAAYNAYLDMDESLTRFLEEEQRKTNQTIDPALTPDAPLAAKKKSGKDGE